MFVMRVFGGRWRWSFMPDYRRFRVPGGTYFFTVNLLERRLDTLVRHVDELREAMRGVRQHYLFHIDAWVVLPDHLHCIWSLPAGDEDFGHVLAADRDRFRQGIAGHRMALGGAGVRAMQMGRVTRMTERVLCEGAAWRC
jgi:REP element-mobilizing transposase RayT